MALENTQSSPGETFPGWMKNAAAGVALVAASVAGTLGVASKTDLGGATAPSALRDIQSHNRELAERITALERNADAQNQSIQYIAGTIKELIAETRETSRQVERLIGTLEQMQR